MWTADPLESRLLSDGVWPSRVVHEAAAFWPQECHASARRRSLPKRSSDRKVSPERYQLITGAGSALRPEEFMSRNIELT